MKRPDASISEFRRDAGSVTVSMKESILDYIEFLEQNQLIEEPDINPYLLSGDELARMEQKAKIS